MIRHLMLCAILFVVCLGGSVAWAADIRYVADQLIITLREGKGNEYRVIKTLRTDTPMEVLEDSGRYLRVRLENGTEGYVLKQYISQREPKSRRIDVLQAEVEQLRTRLEEEGNATAVNQTLQTELERLRQDLASRESELEQIRELSDNALMIDKERKRLKQELETAHKELSKLQHENKTMLSTVTIKWFLAGAGTLMLGWILGKFSRRKQRSSFSRF